MPEQKRLGGLHEREIVRIASISELIESYEDLLRANEKLIDATRIFKIDSIVNPCSFANLEVVNGC